MRPLAAGGHRGRLPIAFPDRPGVRISHEQIYRWVYADSRNRGMLHGYLRRGHVHRRRRRRLAALRARFPDRVDIDQRPTIVDARARFGDWEGDTVLGRVNNGVIATHAERKSGYLLAIKLPSRHAQPLADATIQAFKRLPRRWRHTLTYRGSEGQVLRCARTPPVRTMPPSARFPSRALLLRTEYSSNATR